jgi:hypothetical protein
VFDAVIIYLTLPPQISLNLLNKFLSYTSWVNWAGYYLRFFIFSYAALLAKFLAASGKELMAAFILS